MRRILSFFSNLFESAPSALAVVMALAITSACTPKEEEAIDKIVIESVSPSSGDVTGGYALTISGSGFTFIEQVTVGGEACPVTAIESNAITCTAPARSAGTATVSVVGKADRSASSSFTYLVVNPEFTSLTPTFGNPSGGTTVYVTGAGFSSSTRVFIGTKTFTTGLVPDAVNECETPIIFSPTYLSCSSPVLAVGTYDVHVWNPNDGTDSGVGAYTVYPAPTFTSIVSDEGPTSGGTLVTITGSGFLAGVRIQFGTATCTNVIVDSSTSVRCRTPARPKGTYALRITNRDLQSVLATGAFVYNDTASISAVVPTAGAIAGGTDLTVYGSFFASDTTVTINGIDCPVVSGSVTSSTLRCTTPANAAGTYSVSVVNPGTTAATLAGAYTYQEAPTLTSVTPTSGPTVGGVPVTIAGNYFRTGVVVTIGGTACTVTALSLTSITCTPAAATTSGAKTITVTNLDNQTVTGLTYTHVPAPTFTSLSPAAVAVSGGTSITITGTGFQSVPAVKIGTDDCLNEAFVSATSITCDAPAKTAGVYPLTVTNPDGQLVTTTTNVVTYLDPVTVTSISPSAGALLGGTNLTIAGTNFFAGAVATIGGTPCTTTTVLSAIAISCVGIPTVAVAGSAAVVVTNVDGQSGTSPTPYAYQEAPTASTITPNTGVIGGGYTVVVSGANFLTGATVSLGPVTCGTPTVDEVLDTITCLVPAAPSGTGTVNVVVTNSDGQAATITGGFSFTPPPDATSVTPTAASTAVLETLTISGTSFLSPTVDVSGDACAVTSSSATSIVCDVTVATAGAKTITVTNSDGQTDTLTGLTFMDTPTISSRSPTNGALAGGTTLTITGTNFYAGATVTIAGLACSSPTVTPPTTITCTVPAGPSGSQALVVTNLDGQTASSTYTYNLAPTITSFTPTTGFGVGGATVTITGTNFLTGLTAQVGSTPCTTTTFSSATSVDCVVPAGTGVQTITVTNPDLQTVTSSGTFTYVPAPTVTAISPAVGKASGGTAVTVTGTNFVSGATVSINGVACASPTFVSATSLTCTTALTAAGAYAVVVQNPDTQTGTSAAGLFTFYNAPTITTVAPDGGSPTGGGGVVISGTNFVSGATGVTIGGVNCSGVTVTGSTSLTCTAPGGTVGAADVVVTTVDGLSVTSVGSYTFRYGPLISGVTPAYGQRTGGTAVTITGAGFLGSGLTTPVVKFDDSTAVCSAWTNNTINCLTPTESAGTVVVTVTNADGQVGTLYPAFTFLDAPTVTGVSPNAGTVSGGTVVTITGTNFFSGATVTVGGVACTSRTVLSSTSISCAVPAGAAGAKTVSVTNVDGQAGSLASAFTHQNAPTVTSVSPASGPPVGGYTIAITGTGFVTGATVRVRSGGMSYLCTSVTVVSSTSITCVTPAASAGYYDLVVTNADTQVGTLTNGFRYRTAPTISSISSSGGPLAGGQTFTVFGAGFESGDTVSIGGVNCTTTTFSGSTQLQCTTGAHSANTYSLSVTAGASTATLTSAYTYRAAPTVSGISPSQGLPSGGTAVTITGSGFIASPTVKIGTADCTSIVRVSDSSITCVTPAGVLGAFAVQVTNTDGQYSAAGTNFTYVDLPLLVFVTGTASPTPPNPDSYGSTTTNVTHTFTIQNSGSANATGVVAALTGSGAAGFTLGTDNCTGATILPNTSCTIQVTFNGALLTPGTYSAVLEVSGTGFTTVTNNLSGTRSP